MNEKSVKLFFFIGIMALSAGFFVFDVIADLLEHANAGQTYSANEFIHLIIEVIAVVGLIFGVLLAVRYTRFLKYTAQQYERTLTMFRGQFDEVAAAQFEKWSLSDAERDVALMTLRGLPLAEIASARKTSVGTIKAQTNAIFRKSGLGSRTEFLSYFLDEFLDHGTV